MNKNQIIKKTELTEQITELEIFAPEIAQSALPGQFIIYKIDEQGERIPLTIADTNQKTGAVTIAVSYTHLTGKLSIAVHSAH